MTQGNPKYTYGNPNHWFTSDLCLGDEKVAVERGFSNTTQHDGWIMNMLTTVTVGPLDVIWILGDIGHHSKIDPLQEIGCKLRLIYGDKDRCHPRWLDSPHPDYMYERKPYKFFDMIVPYAPIRAGGKRCMMSHTPYDWDSDVDNTKFARFNTFRLRDEGDVLVHGHTRKPDVTSWSWNGSPQFNVAPDAWSGTLVPLSEIEKFAEVQVT
jgi:calcineurin-like phosphoesterase family protein